MTTFADLPAVLTVEEAARLLRIGRSAAYDAARRGELPVIRVGRLLRVPRHRLEALLGIPESGSPADEEAESAGDQKSSVEAARDSGYPVT